MKSALRPLASILENPFCSALEPVARAGDTGTIERILGRCHWNHEERKSLLCAFELSEHLALSGEEALHETLCRSLPSLSKLFGKEDASPLSLAFQIMPLARAVYLCERMPESKERANWHLPHALLSLCARKDLAPGEFDLWLSFFLRLQQKAFDLAHPEDPQEHEWLARRRALFREKPFASDANALGTSALFVCAQNAFPERANALIALGAQPFSQSRAREVPSWRDWPEQYCLSARAGAHDCPPGLLEAFSAIDLNFCAEEKIHPLAIFASGLGACSKKALARALREECIEILNRSDECRMVPLWTEGPTAQDGARGVFFLEGALRTRPQLSPHLPKDALGENHPQGCKRLDEPFLAGIGLFQSLNDAPRALLCAELLASIRDPRSRDCFFSWKDFTQTSSFFPEERQRDMPGFSGLRAVFLSHCGFRARMGFWGTLFELSAQSKTDPLSALSERALEDFFQQSAKLLENNLRPSFETPEPLRLSLLEELPILMGRRLALILSLRDHQPWFLRRLWEEHPNVLPLLEERALRDSLPDAPRAENAPVRV